MTGGASVANIILMGYQFRVSFESLKFLKMGLRKTFLKPIFKNFSVAIPTRILPNFHY